MSSSPMPLCEKLALTYQEVAALGLCKERTLRKLIATGKVKKSVLRVGRSVKFLRVELIRELREA
jgi:hypothetical protein